MKITQLLLPTYRQMLKALAGWLRKADQQLGGADALLAAKLAPDMFPLATQVRFACVQAYEGVVIAKRNRGLNSSFIVRKVSSGEGVERTFQLYSPLIAGIEVKRRGDVRRAKLYFLRQRSGKSARIKEKLA